MNKTLEYISQYCLRTLAGLTPAHLKRINGGHRYRVYRNLNKHCFSIQSRAVNSSYKVVAHFETLFLYRCKFKVLESGRKRVINEKRKNVHAYVMPIAIESVDKDVVFNILELREIYYNPYHHSTFVYVDSGLEVSDVLCVLAYKNKLYHYPVTL